MVPTILSVFSKAHVWQPMAAAPSTWCNRRSSPELICRSISASMSEAGQRGAAFGVFVYPKQRQDQRTTGITGDVDNKTSRSSK